MSNDLSRDRRSSLMLAKLIKPCNEYRFQECEAKRRGCEAKGKENKVEGGMKHAEGCADV